MLPLTATLGVRRRVEGAEDAHGNPVVSHGNPEPWPVHALAPGAVGTAGGNVEPSQANRDLSVIVWTVYAPADDKAPGALDLVVVDGEDYEVDAEPADWTRGPWPHPTAGIVVELKRPEG